MRSVEVKHVRRKDIDLERVWDVESATGKGALYVGHSKNETSKRKIPLNGAAATGFRFHDLCHTVVTDLLEADEPEHVIQAVTGQLSKKMLEHYSHQRLKAKGQMLTRMEERRKQKESA